ncbi:hypothetical protein ACFSJ3_18370 [Corallincola platygyrae]|uniref:Uncharacterized protein n=1 Tax=Corallincola platygyrae TaxID=1193278 RepID=A0ABW4XU00_9GAMM
MGVHINGVKPSLRTGHRQITFLPRKLVEGKWVDADLEDSFNGLVARGPSEIVVVKLTPGTYSLFQVIWLPEDSFSGQDIGVISLKCVGTFDIKLGQITYAGEFHFDAGETDIGIFSNDLYFRVRVSDNYESVTNWLASYRDNLFTKYPTRKQLIGPWSCHSSEDFLLEMENLPPQR